MASSIATNGAIHAALAELGRAEELGADAYFGLREGLESLLQRPIDLVMSRAVRNPFFLEAIEPTRVVMYAS